jgi:N-acetylglucosaminyldiphosphoundecaprenol N-acetyl-beta-D-mannosaminyltransferase
MEEFFGINYTFGKDQVQAKIDDMLLSRQKGYIIVADGVTLSMSHKNKDLKKVLDESGMTICDSGWVPLYLRFLYHIRREQYSGSDFLMDRVQAKKYKMMFLGSSSNTLQALKTRLSAIDERIASMPFVSLPFLDVSEFNYPEIAQQINEQDPDLIFVSLGMPKQEFFMHNLYPYLNRGILVGVGAAFKFHSGLANQKRAPKWMIRLKMEWIFRIFSEPKKQIKRCSLIISSMPCIFAKECKKRKKKYGS